MNQVLEIAGGFIYVAFRIVLLPVFILFDIVMGAWLLAKWTQRQSTKINSRWKQKQATYQLGVKKSVVLLRAKFDNTAANTH